MENVKRYPLKKYTNQEPPIIGIIGPKGSGKTSLAYAMYDVLEGVMGIQRIRFAGPIKEMVACLLENCGMNGQLARRHVDGDLKGREIEELPGDGVTARDLMQTLGTEWGRRHVDTDLWLETAIRRAQESIDLGRLVVIDDVRFPNEAERICDMGGVIVQVQRPGHGWDTSHESELALVNYTPDYIVENSGTLDDLRTPTRTLLTDLGHVSKDNHGLH